jgi:DNA-binding transcriptional MerR regulator
MKYSIEQVSKISGVNKITLRSWEKRYNFLVPSRTETNIRYYSQETLVCALNTKVLLSENIKISTIATKSKIEICELVDHKFLDSKNENKNILIARVIRAALCYDRNLFDATLIQGFKKYGLAIFYFEIMFIALEKIGYIWEVKSNDPKHEKFVSILLENKIQDITRELKETKMSKDIWLLFIMSPYVFLNRSKSHFISLKKTTKMVADASGNISDRWSF